jgi:hypothetical protein
MRLRLTEIHVAFMERLQFSSQSSNIFANNSRNGTEIGRIQPIGRRKTGVPQFQRQLKYKADTVSGATVVEEVGSASSNAISSYCVFHIYPQLLRYDPGVFEGGDVGKRRRISVPTPS